MPTISPTLPSDGDDASVSAYNPAIIAMLALMNGGLDGDNIDPSFTDSMTVGDLTITGDLTIQGNETAAGWNPLGAAVPSTITYNGNRSYTLAYNDGVDYTSLVCAGMRLMTTRSVAAPTQCTSLNGTSQYFSKSAPAGMTFTDDFVAGAWVKLTSYPTAGTTATMESRFNGTSGWAFQIRETGQVVLNGFNAGGSNFSGITSYQSIPLNKWVHITAQLDMSAFTATTTTSYVMIDCVDVPASVARGGTNPTALVQAGDFNIGSFNAGAAGSFFPGKIAQAFVSSAKITQANVKTLYSQGLTSALITANSIISAYSFDNAITDLNTTNANNLTANGGAVATNADSPFGGQASGSISSTLDYAIVQKGTFSTNTTFTVQVPEGCTIPTSGGVSAVVYSSAGKPYGMPTDEGRWTVETCNYAQLAINATTAATWYYTNLMLSVPIGSWNLEEEGFVIVTHAGATFLTASMTLATTTAAENDRRLTFSTPPLNLSSAQNGGFGSRKYPIQVSAQTPYYANIKASSGSSTVYLQGNDSATIIRAKNAYL